MNTDDFAELLSSVPGIRVTPTLTVYSDMTGIDYATGRRLNGDTVEALCAAYPDLAQAIAASDAFPLSFDGRGSSGGAGADMSGKFSSAGDANGDDSRPLFPARLNLGTARGTSVERQIDKFRERYGGADHEYGAVIDRDGYAIEHTDGGRSSVRVYVNANQQRGATMLHNHPSGGAFSSTDLHTFANSNLHGMVATSNTATYRIQRTSKFKPQAFDRAVTRARWDVNKYPDYSDGADWWLRTNADKYGYRYQRTKH